ncbi:MAG: hypothetical protein ACKESB_01455 [Candidatus Hodgkinia cicadicola]
MRDQEGEEKRKGREGRRGRGREDETRFNPRTCFNRITEAAVFDMLQLIDPTAVSLGEESVRLNDGARGCTWIVDVSGGTKAFACGSKIWSTLLALITGGDLRLSALNHSELHEGLIGITGETYWR